jgi:uncharacterized protein YcbK (DUF882 family)
MLIKFLKTDTTQISPHFTVDEFKCPCNSCTENFIDDVLIEKLEEVRVALGPLRVTSGYRCPQHNKDVGGAPSSSHMAGLAADIQPIPVNVDDLDKLYEKCFYVFDNIGDGRRLRFVHVDVREEKKSGQKRTWSY